MFRSRLMPMSVFLVILVAGCGGPDPQEQLEANKAVVSGYLEEVFNQGQWELWDRYLTEFVIFNGLEMSRESFMKMSMQMRLAFPDFRMEIEDQVAEGTKVATRVTFRGTHEGDFMGIPATGKTVAYQGFALDQVVDGKVTSMWHEADTWSLLQQLGIR
jgi:steroid delta-isomerase-like uncharacterized protein